MLQDLSQYYFEKGILSTHFKCPHYPQCLGNSGGLVNGKSAYVGSDYEKHTLPRILFVSLDMGSDKDFENPSQRTPEGVRAVENRNWQIYNPLLHWYATHKLAVLIAQIFRPNLVYKDANDIFAHTNSTKCCEIKKGNDMSKNILYRNCREYLSGEFKILDPDIIIGQGGESYKGIETSCEDLSNQLEFRSIVNIHERIRVVKINSRPVLYIKSIYPTWRNDRTRKQENELYPFYFSAVKAFAQLVNLT